ncbi:hypothetical protein L0F63_006246, partial [Massospora cicadina]
NLGFREIFMVTPSSSSDDFTRHVGPNSVELGVTDQGRSATLLPPPTNLLLDTSSLIDNWNAVKDYNLRTGIPNLEQLLSGKGRPPLDLQTFTTYVADESSVGGLLLKFYRRAAQFEAGCLQYEHRYPLPPQPPSSQPPARVSKAHGRSLVPSPTMPPDEVDKINELREVARDLIDDFLDPRSNHYFGCPAEFLWRARAGLDSPGVPWGQLLSPAKQHAFNLLNTHFYGSFVKFCFHTNVTPASAQLCLFAGSVLLVLALTIPLSMIFYGLDPRSTRLALLPFAFVGSLLLLASYTRFFPPLGLRRLREGAFRRCDVVIDPLVQRAHYRRAWVHLSLALAATTILATIFICVPSNRLMREVHR